MKKQNIVVSPLETGRFPTEVNERQAGKGRNGTEKEFWLNPPPVQQ